jgi:hypothetical protein
MINLEAIPVLLKNCSDLLEKYFALNFTAEFASEPNKEFTNDRFEYFYANSCPDKFISNQTVINR